MNITMASTLSAQGMLFDTGSVIDGKWVLIERVGKGGMGEVYRAHQLNLKRDVAFKVLSEDILQDIDENPEEIVKAAQRLQVEVQTMAQVRHPNVLQIYDYGSVSVQHNGIAKQVPYIAMEYVPGNTFRYTMSEEGFGEETELLAEWIAHYLIPVLDGLEAIHDHDIVHRDIKPENILMDGDTPKITDFGLARSTRLKAVSNSWDVKGTMPYMAPEQFADFRKARIPADVYSLGKVLFEAVSGRLDKKMIPFKSAGLESPATTFLKTINVILHKATDESPHNRYQTISEMRFALLNAIQSLHEENTATLPTGPTPKYVRWLWVGIIAVLIAVGGMTVYHFVGNETSKQARTADISEPDNTLAALKETGRLSSTMMSKDGREMVLVKDIEFYSMCEHHMLPFFGKAHIAYIPNGKIVGLSKVPRLVEIFARRLQVQERLTEEIASALSDQLNRRMYVLSIVAAIGAAACLAPISSDWPSPLAGHRA